MLHYTFIQWLFFFYFYCFFGWCFESTYVSIKSRKLVNRGFMRGPFLPLYGSGGIMMLVVSMPFQDNVVLTYIAGVIGATALEYVTGVTMEALFKVRYWDYSKNKFNFQGHICLGSSLAWGGLTILMTKVIHKPIEHFVLSIPTTALTVITCILTVYIVVDFTLSFKAAMDLRDILVKIEKAREELERMQHRLDIIIAFNNEEKEQKKQEREMRMAELSANLEQRFNGIKEAIQSKPMEYSESVREEIADLRARFNLYMEGRKNFKGLLDFYKRDMIRNNPTMASKKFKDAFEELKNAVSRRSE
jgi:uncharacterized membrane protein